MPYTALEWRTVRYKGNRVHDPRNIEYGKIETAFLENRVARVVSEETFARLANIDDAIFQATVEYFSNIGSKWTNLPLTTLMISSPGEVYAGQTLDYTTDTLPVEIPDWFWTGKRIFLSESSQFYLELALMAKGADSVFSIYNSFRKEPSDATHLSEFQHVEFEGKCWVEECKKVFIGLCKHVFRALEEKNSEDLLFFLDENTLKSKSDMMSCDQIVIGFREALDVLYSATKNEMYKDFSLKNFGTWEEVKLTELLGGNVIVEKFPMLQIPFYHAIAEEEIDGVPVAKNADYILYGFRETVGAGERIRDKETLMKKADIFHLPKRDYLPYLESRNYRDYVTTSGFGLWWQRYVQWLTDQPYIYESTLFPRTHLIPNP